MSFGGEVGWAFYQNVALFAFELGDDHWGMGLLARVFKPNCTFSDISGLWFCPLDFLGFGINKVTK